MLMWSHYSDEHRGMIEKYNCFPVIYSNKMPQRMTLDINNKKELNESILTKSKDWEYEAEWRVIDIDGDNAGKSVCFK